MNVGTMKEYLYGDGQPEGATVRQILTDVYGDRFATSIDHVADVVNTYRTDYKDLLVFRLASANDVHGYDDALNVSNFNTLESAWGTLDAWSRGPYSNADYASLWLDETAPEDLVSVIDALADYPVLSDDEYSRVEQEMITEHWESYGRYDALSAVADALGVDGRSCLTEYVTEVVDALTFDGYFDEYPTFIDSSAVDFHTDVVVAWVKEYVPSNVGVDRFITLRRYASDKGLAVDTDYDHWVTPETS